MFSKLVENDEFHERQHKKKYYNHLQESKTVKSYSSYFSRFVIMLLKVSWRSNPICLKLHKHGCARLWNEVGLHTLLWLFTCCNVSKLQVLQLEECLSCVTQEANMDGGDLMIAAVNKLHCVMVFVLSKVWHPCSSKLTDLFYIFLIGSHMENDGGEWKDVSLISRNVAVLQYFCRGTVLLDCIKDYRRTTELPSTTSNAAVEDTQHSYSLLHPITRADNRHEVRPYSTLLEMMRLGSAYSNTTNLPVCVWETGTNYFAQRVNGSLGDLRIIKASVHLLLDDTERMIKECLQEFDLSISVGENTVDDLRCARLNYSFVSQESNGLRDAGKQYTYHLVKRFYRTSPDTRFDASVPQNWIKGKLRLWWKLCDTVMLQVILLVIITSGMPPRMTEFVQLRIRNSRSAKRNLFLLQGQLLFLSTYNKTDSVTGVDKAIARFLHHRVSKLLSTIVMYIRPAQAALAAAYLRVNTTDAVIARSDLLSYFCVLEGKRMNAESIRSKFHSLMLGRFGCDWTIADWRHGIIQWARVFLSSEVEKRYKTKVELQTVRSAQVGNTPRLELVRYGIEPCSFEELDSMAVDSYREYSNDYQQLLFDLDVTLPSGVSVSPTASPTVHATTPIMIEPGITNPSNTNPLGTCVTEDSVTLADAVGSKVKELLDQLSNNDELIDVLKRDVLGPLHLLLRKSKYQTAENTIVTIESSAAQDNEDTAKLLKAMEALKHPFKTFRSSAQRQAISHCWKNNSDLLAILPTGGGKTAIFAIPAALDGSGFTTVVIVPTVALADDMEHQLQAVYKLRCAQWTKLSMADRRSPYQSPQILLMTVECVSQELAKSYISFLENHNRLRRIVIDEAHLILYW